MIKARSFIQEMRPLHYVKNVLVFIPLFFSGQFLNFDYICRLIGVFVFFSLIGSCVYFINDIVDYPYDVLNPEKQSRPIAAGKISRKSAVVFAVLLFIVGMAGLLLIQWQSALVALIYFALNLAYSFGLKKIALLDVFCIAMGFVLRLFVGSAAVSVAISHWMLLTFLCLSMFLAFGKRRNEMLNAEKGVQTRKVLESYNVSFIDKAMFSMMTLTITFYALWALDTQQSRIGEGSALLFTVPLVILALLRYMSIVEKSTSGDPTNIITKDKFMLILAAILVVILGALLYF